MASVFMSFIHEEENVAKHVHDFLREIFNGQIDTFRSSDRSAIYAGEEWMDRIFEELKSAKVLISLLSPVSVNRPWINFEAGAAWMKDTKVIPVCFGGLTIENLPKPYSSLQAVELKTLQSAYYLVSSIAHHLGLPEPKRPFLGPDGGVSLACQNPEEQKELRRPYKMLLWNVEVDMDEDVRQIQKEDMHS